MMSCPTIDFEHFDVWRVRRLAGRREAGLSRRMRARRCDAALLGRRTGGDVAVGGRDAGGADLSLFWHVQVGRGEGGDVEEGDGDVVRACERDPTSLVITPPPTRHPSAPSPPPHKLQHHHRHSRTAQHHYSASKHAHTHAMDTIHRAASAASSAGQAIFRSHPADGSHAEPVSGQTGNTRVGEPYDAGNMGGSSTPCSALPSSPLTPPPRRVPTLSFSPPRSSSWRRRTRTTQPR